MFNIIFDNKADSNIYLYIIKFAKATIFGELFLI